MIRSTLQAAIYDSTLPDGGSGGGGAATSSSVNPINVSVSNNVVTLSVNQSLLPYRLFYPNVTWYFGDGGSHVDAYDATIQYTYLAGGTYVITLQYVGSSFTVSVTVSLPVTPVPVPTGNPVNLSINGNVVTVSFNPNVVPYQQFFPQATWNFGDGTAQVENWDMTVQHAYAVPGRYTISVEYYGSVYSTGIIDILVTPSPTPVTTENPVELNVTQGSVPLDVSFRIHAVSVPYRLFYDTVRWDFGDGLLEDHTYDEIFIHTYQQQGLYRPKFYYYDTWYESWVQIDVAAPAPVQQQNPIIVSSYNGNAPHYVTFQLDQNIVPQQSVFVAPFVQWNFGDGTVENYAWGTNPGHTYRTPGSYAVIVTYGSQVFYTSTSIVVGQPETFNAEIRANKQSGIAPLDVYFQVYVMQGSLQTGQVYEWDFGDGEKLNTSSPGATHTFLVPGTYSVTVKAYDISGTVHTLSGRRLTLGIDIDVLAPETSQELPSESIKAGFGTLPILLVAGAGISYLYSQRKHHTPKRNYGRRR